VAPVNPYAPPAAQPSPVLPAYPGVNPPVAVAPVQPLPPAPPRVAAPVPAAIRTGIVLSRRQALAWDSGTGEYRILRAGDAFEGGRVTSFRGQRMLLAQAGGLVVLKFVWPPRRARAFAAPQRMPVIAVPPSATAAAPAAPVTPLPGAPAAPAAPAVPLVAPSVPAPPLAPIPALPAPAAPPAALPPAQLAPPAAAPPTYAPPQGAPRADAGRTRVIERTKLDAELRDFSSLASQVSVTPAVKGGFLVTRVSAKTFVGGLGLRVGDVIKRLDEIALDSFDDAAKAYAHVQVVQQFTLTVERNGRPVALKYTVRG
jgi:hypothetical protein